ncbi:MAG: 4-alpha-glucanotransferase [Chlamydiae bacterium]|nr:4-alpha-glucanotransferase [Chlamydiota bacterium]
MHARGAGVSIPIFSLRSKKGCGGGEFLDLIPLIDWAEMAGLGTICILPINDTSMTETAGDGYPYSILSAFTLHPIYLNLSSLAPELEKEIAQVAKDLNHPKFDYFQTYQAKKQLLKKIFKIRGAKDLSTKSFATFLKKNVEHLVPYVAFCLLRDRYKTSDFRIWGKEAEYSDKLAQKLCCRQEAQFYFFVQYHLDKQLRQVVRYAKKKGIQLMGDFPVGVHPSSVEAWRFSRYFRWNRHIGAPPDFYNDLGQNWGFPAYDWEKIKEENFFWLTSRLQWMDRYFDVMRLDHVLGYFRLWEVPVEEVRGLMGRFYPSIPFTEKELASHGFTDINRLIEPHQGARFKSQREVERKIRSPQKRKPYFKEIENRLFLKEGEDAYHPRIDLKSTASFKALNTQEQKKILELFDHYYLERQEKLWEEKGKEKLLAMKKGSGMLICAEDIGVIPACVGRVLEELDLLNTHVQRMPKSFALEFEHPKDFPERCFCMPSNHDTAPLRSWWEEDLERTKRYYNQILGHDGDPPEELTESLAEEIISAHLRSKARFALFLLQDLFALSDAIKFPDPFEERINDPADPLYQWNWRMHLYVEELMLAKSFAKKIEGLVREANR